MTERELPVFKKLPLGGVDRRALVAQLAKDGPRVARELLARERASLRRVGTTIAADTAVLLLGGSNGLTRSLALQLLLGEGVAVVAVHYDSEKMQIGGHHVAALREAAAEAGVGASFVNADAARPDTADGVIAELLRGRYRAVHLVNGIAAGAPKRHERFGPTRVTDLDVGFDPVLQVPEFQRESIRKLGLVEVEVASAADVERTHRYMGSSTQLWADKLAEAGLLAREESLVAFCDYDFPPDDPVYGMGPLADAKRAQRESLVLIAERHGARTARLCYPAMATTALGAIPGGMFLYALTTEILLERGAFQSIPELAAATMALWQPPLPAGELRLDAAFQEALDEFRRRQGSVDPADLAASFPRLLGR